MTLISYRFHLFVHDEVKAEFLKENEHDVESMKFIEQLSQPAGFMLAEMKTPRFIKTHLPISLLPPSVFEQKAKVGWEINGRLYANVISMLFLCFPDHLRRTEPFRCGCVLLPSESALPNARIRWRF